MQKFPLIIASILAITACATSAPTHESAPTIAYFDQLRSLCNGSAYAGQLVSADAVDADFAESDIVMGPARCDDTRIELPLAVGADRSRIWQVTLNENGVRLKHDHTHADGTKDTVTQYGGDSLGSGTAYRQSFPVDAETRKVFTAAEITVSNQNTWAMDIYPGLTFAYEMWRPNRHFRLVFDLRNPVDAPPAPWADVPVE